MDKTNEREILKSMTLDLKKNKAELIIEEINSYFNVDCRIMSRKRDIVLPRQIAMYYIKFYLDLNYSLVGSFFPSNKTKDGFIDHSTVIHACNSVDGLINFDPETKKHHENLKDVCYSLATYSKKDYKKHLTIREINDNLQKLDLEELNLINDNIKNNEKTIS